MNKKLNIICHAFPSWRGDYLKSTVQLMKEMANDHHVLYIDYAYSWKDILVNSWKNSYIPLSRILGFSSPLEKVVLSGNATIHVLSLPPIIPYNWISNEGLFNFIRNINRIIVRGRISKAVKQLKFQEPYVVNAFNPYFDFSLFKEFKPSKSVYYCYDNIDAAAWASKHGSRLEKEVMTEADITVYTSTNLQQTKSNKSIKSVVVTNGVDLRIFEKEMNYILVPRESSKVDIGYVGSVDDRLDYQLLELMVRSYPDWGFHFYGRIVGKQVERLEDYPNVHFYGSVPVEQLPVKIRNFNVAIIPFVKSEFTKNIYPMKANEYLALGVPVVMTAFAELPGLEGYVSVVDGAGFVKQLHTEIDNDTPDLKIARMQKAVTNSWKNKADEFIAILRK